MRVLMAHSFYRVPGGEDRYVLRLMDLLEARHEVRLLGPRNVDLREGIRTAASMAYSRKRLQEARDAIDEFEPHLIHLNNPYPSLGASVHLAASKAGVPLIVTVHNLRMRCPNGLMFTEGAICRRCQEGAYFNAALHQCFPRRTQGAAYATVLWLHRFVVHLEEKVSLFICPSNYMRDRLLSWGLDESKLRVVPHFIPMDVPASSKPGRYGIYVGRLSQEKGVDTLLDALKEAGDPEFLIVGGGPLAEDLKRRSAELGLMNTSFLGHVDPERVRSLLSESRFLVMPSACEESASLAAMEAMSVGRPLLVTSLGALPELVSTGAGIAFTAGNVAELARGIDRLMADDGFCQAAGERSLTIARERFSAQSHLSKLEGAYESALTRRSG
ncbi:MAG: glycosyltransferase family 4 protein [Actinomycetota bacterium]